MIDRIDCIEKNFIAENVHFLVVEKLVERNKRELSINKVYNYYFIQNLLDYLFNDQEGEKKNVISVLIIGNLDQIYFVIDVILVDLLM